MWLFAALASKTTGKGTTELACRTSFHTPSYFWPILEENKKVEILGENFDWPPPPIPAKIIYILHTSGERRPRRLRGAKIWSEYLRKKLAGKTGEEEEARVLTWNGAEGFGSVSTLRRRGETNAR